MNKSQYTYAYRFTLFTPYLYGANPMWKKLFMLMVQARACSVAWLFQPSQVTKKQSLPQWPCTHARGEISLHRHMRKTFEKFLIGLGRTKL